MKKLCLFIVFVMIALIIIGNKTKISLEMVSSEVKIGKYGDSAEAFVDEKGITHLYKPIVLYYKVALKNAGSDIGKNIKKDLQMKIIPNDDLIQASEEVLGFNVFIETNGYRGGEGRNSISYIKENEVGDFDLFYSVGFDEDTPSKYTKAPSKQKLALLQEKMTDAVAVITDNNERNLVSFTLSK
ncbi:MULTISPECIES: hypothetical protein [Bacillus]|uniref:hypothetical protein n=1 Tax=Bacillus TaxID=1386 RepID=UPI000314E4A6|nr:MULTISPECIES: hypothetical protein [Bacillus]